MSTEETPEEHNQTGFRSYRLNLIEELFDNTPMPTCILEGPDHRLRYMNQRFRQLYGNRLLRPGVQAKDILSYFKGYKGEAGNGLKILNRIYTTGEPFFANEFKASIDSKGTGELEERYFNLICQPLKDIKEEVYGLFIIGYEVTGQVEYRQEIVEQERKLKIALEGANIGFWEVDAKNKVFNFVSDEFKEQLGYPPEASLSYQDFLEAVHPDDIEKVRNKYKQAADADRLYEVEYRVVWPDGSLHWILDRGQIIFDENGVQDRRIGVSIDITQSKQVEQQLKETLRLRDNFLSIASHELQTPVTSMKVQAELFERQLSEAGDQAYAEQARKISERVDELSRLTGELLDISRIEEGKLQLEKELFPISGLIEDSANTFRHVSHHDIEIRGSGTQYVYADRFRIGQVLMNLLENAIKYSPDENKIIIRYRVDAGKVVVSVTDFGIGVSREDQQKVFQRFFKGKDKIKETYPGFGVGLYISLKIVERHGGGIWVEDNKGKGSVFSFSLPLADAGN